VQHPEDALASGMPLSALRYVQVDHVAPLAKIGAVLRRLINEPCGDSASVGCHEESSTANQGETMNQKEMEQKFGPPSALICPECNGPIWEATDGNHTQYRCLVGHIFSPESFVAEEGVAVERALWVAVKTLQERSDLLRRLADKAMQMGQSISGASFVEKAEESEQHGKVIREILRRLDGVAQKPETEKSGKSNQVASP
jgi:two-component system chemotaxis response regulator CheB